MTVIATPTEGQRRVLAHLKEQGAYPGGRSVMLPTTFWARSAGPAARRGWVESIQRGETVRGEGTFKWREYRLTKEGLRVLEGQK